MAKQANSQAEYERTIREQRDQLNEIVDHITENIETKINELCVAMRSIHARFNQNTENIKGSIEDLKAQFINISQENEKKIQDIDAIRTLQENNIDRFIKSAEQIVIIIDESRKEMENVDQQFKSILQAETNSIREEMQHIAINILKDKSPDLLITKLDDIQKSLWRLSTALVHHDTAVRDLKGGAEAMSLLGLNPTKRPEGN